MHPRTNSLQRFKIDVASTVVNQQNAGLNSMETDQILDLFDVDSVDKGVGADLLSKKGGAGAGAGADQDGREEDTVDAMGQVKEKGKQGWLDGLGELWDQGQYEEEYNLDEFLGRMKG